MPKKDNVSFVIGVKNKTKAAFKKLRKSLRTLKSSVLNLKTAVFALAGVGGFGMLVKSSMGTVDALAKQSDQMGMNIQTYAGLQHALSITTDGTVNFKKSIQTMSKTIRDANDGLATYKRTYAELGLDTKELEKLAPDEQFLSIADALAKTENQTRRTAMAMDIFGARNAQLLNTINLGRGGLEAYRKEAIALGLAVSRMDAAKIEAANDAFTRVKGVIKGVGNQIAVALSPYLEAISKYLVNASVASGGFKKAIGSAMKYAIEGAAYLGNAFVGLIQVWHAIKFAFMSFADAFWKSIASIDRGITDFLNKLPGISVEYSTFIQGVAETTQSNLDAQWGKLREALKIPLPGDSIRKWAADVEKNATIAAKKVAISKDKMVKTDDKGNKGMLKNAIKSAADIFGIQKQLSVATILAKTPQAVATAFANAGGWPAGIPAALATAAKMASEAAAAGGVSLGFGGGGGGSTGGGGGSAPSVPAIAAAPATVGSGTRQRDHVIIHGIDPDKLYTGQQLRDFADRLYETENTGVSFA